MAAKGTINRSNDKNRQNQYRSRIPGKIHDFRSFQEFWNRHKPSCVFASSNRRFFSEFMLKMVLSLTCQRKAVQHTGSVCTARPCCVAHVLYCFVVQEKNLFQIFPLHLSHKVPTTSLPKSCCFGGASYLFFFFSNHFGAITLMCVLGEMPCIRQTHTYIYILVIDCFSEFITLNTNWYQMEEHVHSTRSARTSKHWNSDFAISFYLQQVAKEGADRKRLTSFP